MKLSEKIESILNFYDESQRTYRINVDIVKECDNKTQDFLHSIELENLKCNERSKLATAERKNRQERRKAKDEILTYSTLIQKFIDLPETKRSINTLRQVLGEIRREENGQKNRTYRKRSNT